MLRIFRIIILMLIPFSCFSQKGVTTVGIQVKPIFPFSFLGTGKITNDKDGVHFETILKSGFSGGLIIRHNFTDLIAFESGINYVKRKYSLSISDGDFTGNSSFRIISYEIPAMLMIYSQLAEKIYINGSMGPTLDMFASDIQTSDYYFNQVSFRRKIFQPAIAANVGCEYRTENSGTIYLGASYQRPFSPIYDSVIGYFRNNKEVVVSNPLSGSYLTIDLRYFFPVVKTKITAD